MRTHNVGLSGTAALFSAQLGHGELALLERDLYAELACIRAYDDSLAAVEKLKAAGLKVARCSNLAAPYAVPPQLLLPEFDGYAWSCEVSAIKPEPAIYQYLAEQLHCTASSLAMIGDTLEADVVGPSNAGLQGIHLQREGCPAPQQFTDLLAFADFIVQGAGR
ncbi:MAG: HAD family hydrolase [Pseudomonas sp.]